MNVLLMRRKKPTASSSAILMEPILSEWVLGFLNFSSTSSINFMSYL